MGGAFFAENWDSRENSAARRGGKAIVHRGRGVVFDSNIAAISKILGA